MNNSPIRVLVAGLGNMGLSHALSYHNNPDFQIVGLVNRSTVKLPAELGEYPVRDDFLNALAELKPDLASINTYTETHAEYAIAAMQSGAHVFLEKPLAASSEEAERVVAVAKKTNRKLVVGYILRQHPSWVEFIKQARSLGGPYVFRLNLNQQSSGATWQTHKQLMNSTSPIVDCGVHYVDVMCQITDAKPLKVRGMGVRLSAEIKDDMYNYGHFQVLYDDGSVGWYEAAWGPMISESAFFVKDVMSPNGSVSIIMEEGARSDDMESHTKTSTIRIHKAATDESGEFLNADQNLAMDGEPGHQQLCDREQQFVSKAIRQNINLDRHMQDAVASLRICLAADRSVRTGREVDLSSDY